MTRKQKHQCDLSGDREGREIEGFLPESRANMDDRQSIIEKDDRQGRERWSVIEGIQPADNALQSVDQHTGTAEEVVESSDRKLAVLNQELKQRNNELEEDNQRHQLFLDNFHGIAYQVSVLTFSPFVPLTLLKDLEIKCPHRHQHKTDGE